MPHCNISNINRRTLFLSATAAAIATRLAAQNPSRSAAIVVLLESIDPNLRADQLEAIVREFTSRGVPTAIEIGPQMPREQVAVLGSLQLQQPWLVECAGVLEMEAESPRYFVLRAASDLKSDLAYRGWPKEAAMPCCVPASPVSEGNSYALRAAGFRIRISRISGDLRGLTTIRQTDWGQIEIAGGISQGLGSSQPLPASLPVANDTLFRLSVSASDRAEDAAKWAEALRMLFSSGTNVVTRPSDLLGLFGGGTSSFLSCVVDAEGEYGSDGPVAQFLADLQTEGLPYGLIAEPGLPEPNPLGVCGPNNQISLDSLLRNCVVADRDEDDLLLAPDIRIVLVKPGADIAWTGQRNDGRFQVALAEWAEGSLAERLERYPLSDYVMLLRPSDLATPVQRRSVVTQIVSAVKVGRVHVRSIDGYLDEILAPDHQLEHLWSVRERFGKLAFNYQIAGRLEEGEQRLDALTAWAFMDRYSDSGTGLCAGTVNLGKNPVIDRNITFWDVGSQIQGVLSAHGLAIISFREAQERLATLIASLPTTTIDGHPFPPSIIDGRTGKPVSDEFDSCDIGRFLIALRQAVHKGLIAEIDASALVESWSLSAAIRQGRIHDYRGGKWVDASLTHCNTYALRGFRQWGMSFVRSYPQMPTNPTADDLMRLYYSATDIGHFGTEPALLDLIETNAEAATKELAKVLLTAQMDWFQTTGQPKCVSESPLNSYPWFVFQGLRLDRIPEEAWVIRPKTDSKVQETSDFRRRADIISSKSAFLWHARFPNEYTEMLVSLIREKGRMEGYGFIAGLFAADQSPMSNYGDLNTNGIILKALDYIRRWPD